MRQQQSAVLHFVALVHAIRVSYQIAQHVSDVTAFSRSNNATFACDAGGGSSLQQHLFSQDKSAHHTRKDAIPQKQILLHDIVHTGRRSDKSVSCGDDKASQEAPQQLRR
jgi:hypothetical protein